MLCTLEFRLQAPKQDFCLCDGSIDSPDIPSMFCKESDAAGRNFGCGEAETGLYEADMCFQRCHILICPLPENALQLQIHCGSSSHVWQRTLLALTNLQIAVNQTELIGALGG